MLDTNHLPDFAGCFRIRTHDPVANSEWRVFEYSHWLLAGVLAIPCPAFSRVRAKGCFPARLASVFLDARLIFVFRVLNALLQFICIIRGVVEQFA
jgi:hypothetical protein